MKRSAIERAHAASSTGIGVRLKGAMKLAAALIISVEVVVKLTSRLAYTKITTRIALNAPLAKPAGTKPNDPARAMESNAANGAAMDTSASERYIGNETSPVKEQNAMATATKTYVGAASMKTLLKGMRLIA